MVDGGCGSNRAAFSPWRSRHTAQIRARGEHVPLGWKVRGKRMKIKWSVNSAKVPRCRHGAARLQRTHGLTISPQSAVPSSATQAEAERRVGSILPHSHTTPQGATKFPLERHEIQAVGWKRRRTRRENIWTSPRLPTVVEPNSPALAAQGDPWKHEKLNLSKKWWTQLILPSKELPQTGSEGSRFMFRRKTHGKVWSQWTGCHNRARLNPRITPPCPSNHAGPAHCLLGRHPTQGPTMEAGKPTAGQEQHSCSQRGTCTGWISQQDCVAMLRLVLRDQKHPQGPSRGWTQSETERQPCCWSDTQRRRLPSRTKGKKYFQEGQIKTNWGNKKPY